MKPGPKKKPTVLNLVRGNPGKRARNKDEPKPKPSMPTCPKELTDAAKKEWKRITPLLFGLGLLSEINLGPLGAYCSAYGRWIDAEKEVQKYGMIVESPSGYGCHVNGS